MFYFDLLAERFDPDHPDDRVYRLSELEPGSVAQMLALSRKSAATEPAGRDASRRLDAIRANRRPTALVVYSDRKSTRLNSSHIQKSRMPSSA